MARSIALLGKKIEGRDIYDILADDDSSDKYFIDYFLKTLKNCESLFGKRKPPYWYIYMAALTANIKMYEGAYSRQEIEQHTMNFFFRNFNIIDVRIKGKDYGKGQIYTTFELEWINRDHWSRAYRIAISIES